MASALRLRRKYPISTCRDYSVACASRLTNESMDFVYLDARHDCTLHAASVLGLSLLRWPHSSHHHIPRLTALIDSPSCPMFSLPADKGVLADLNAYWPKLRRGGIMAGYRPTAHTSTVPYLPAASMWPSTHRDEKTMPWPAVSRQSTLHDRCACCRHDYIWATEGGRAGGNGGDDWTINFDGTRSFAANQTYPSTRLHLCDTSLQPGPSSATDSHSLT